MNNFKIGILGAGNIGKTLALKLASAGHEVKIANSRGPDTIEADVLRTGTRAVTTDDVIKEVDVVILSIPFGRNLELSPLIARLPSKIVVIDTSNYYPARDGKIDSIEAGQAESSWLQEKFGRPIAKAWNSIGYTSLESKGKPSGAVNRIAISVAADREEDRKVAMRLVDDTGFDALDGGAISESWRQQGGAPAYCTDLTCEQLVKARAQTDRSMLSERRDRIAVVYMERVGDGKTDPHPDLGVQVCREVVLSGIRL